MTGLSCYRSKNCVERDSVVAGGMLLLLPGHLPAGRQVFKVLYSGALPCLGSQWPGWNCTWPSIRGSPLKPSHWVSWRRGGRTWGQHQSRSEESSICSGTRLKKKKRYLFLYLILFEPYTLLSCQWCKNHPFSFSLP